MHGKRSLLCRRAPTESSKVEGRRDEVGQLSRIASPAFDRISTENAMLRGSISHPNGTTVTDRFQSLSRAIFQQAFLAIR